MFLSTASLLQILYAIKNCLMLRQQLPLKAVQAGSIIAMFTDIVKLVCALFLHSSFFVWHIIGIQVVNITAVKKCAAILRLPPATVFFKPCLVPVTSVS